MKKKKKKNHRKKSKSYNGIIGGFKNVTFKF